MGMKMSESRCVRDEVGGHQNDVVSGSDFQRSDAGKWGGG